MQYILLIIVLIAFAAVGLALGNGFGSFVRKDPFDGKKELYLDEDPDIQTNLHGEE